MNYLLLILIGFVAFLLEVAVAALVIKLVAFLLGLTLSLGGAVGLGLAVILGKNLLASAVRP